MTDPINLIAGLSLTLTAAACMHSAHVLRRWSATIALARKYEERIAKLEEEVRQYRNHANLQDESLKVIEQVADVAIPMLRSSASGNTKRVSIDMLDAAINGKDFPYVFDKYVVENQFVKAPN